MSSPSSHPHVFSSSSFFFNIGEPGEREEEVVRGRIGIQHGTEMNAVLESMEACLPVGVACGASRKGVEREAPEELKGAGNCPPPLKQRSQPIFHLHCKTWKKVGRQERRREGFALLFSFSSPPGRGRSVKTEWQGICWKTGVEEGTHTGRQKQHRERN